MIVTATIKEGEQPTEQQLKEVEEAAKRPIVFDEDCPELSEAMLKTMAMAVSQRNRYLSRRDA